jgi:hypothetical protein
VRGEAHQGTLGNQLAAMRGPLPVYIQDPVARLQFVRRAMDGLKESKQAVGAATLAAVNNLAPPTILAQASRLQFSTRLFNLLVTNIPGPQFPLYVLGRQLEDLFPVAFLPKNHGLAVAIMSYNGGIDYGLLADYDALPDIDVIADGIDAALRELLEATARAGGHPPAPAEPKAEPPARAPDPPRPESTRSRRVSPRAASGNGRGRNGTPPPIVPSGTARSKRGPAADMRAKRATRPPAARKRRED